MWRSKSVKAVRYTALLGHVRAGWGRGRYSITHVPGTRGLPANAGDKGGNWGLFIGPWNKKKS